MRVEYDEEQNPTLTFSNDEWRTMMTYAGVTPEAASRTMRLASFVEDMAVSAAAQAILDTEEAPK